MRFLSAIAITFLLACGTSRFQGDSPESSAERRVSSTGMSNVRELPTIKILRTPAYSTPFGSPSTIPFTLLADGGVLIRILNIKGEIIAESGDCCLEPGEYSFGLFLRDQPKGIYLYQIITAERTHTKMIRWPIRVSWSSTL